MTSAPLTLEALLATVRDPTADREAALDQLTAASIGDPVEVLYEGFDGLGGPLCLPLVRRLGELQPLLSDPEPGVRARAALLMVLAAEPAGSMLEPIAARCAVESDPGARATMYLAGAWARHRRHLRAADYESAWPAFIPPASSESYEEKKVRWEQERAAREALLGEPPGGEADALLQALARGLSCIARDGDRDLLKTMRDTPLRLPAMPLCGGCLSGLVRQELPDPEESWSGEPAGAPRPPGAGRDWMDPQLAGTPPVGEFSNPYPVRGLHGRIQHWPPGLMSVDWEGLHDAYGVAVEAPRALLALTSTDARDRDRARWHISVSIHHQGSVYPATRAVVPFLADIAARPELPARVYALSALGWFASVEFDALARPDAERTPIADAIEAQIAAVHQLLTDADPAVQRAAIRLTGQLWELGEPAAPTLLALLRAEDPGVRAGAILAAGLVGRSPQCRSPLRQALLSILLDGAGHVLLRTLAAISLARLGSPPEEAIALLREHLHRPIFPARSGGYSWHRVRPAIIAALCMHLAPAALLDIAQDEAIWDRGRIWAYDCALEALFPEDRAESPWMPHELSPLQRRALRWGLENPRGSLFAYGLRGLDHSEDVVRGLLDGGGDGRMMWLVEQPEGRRPVWQVIRRVVWGLIPMHQLLDALAGWSDDDLLKLIEQPLQCSTATVSGLQRAEDGDDRMRLRIVMGRILARAGAPGSAWIDGVFSTRWDWDQRQYTGIVALQDRFERGVTSPGLIVYGLSDLLLQIPDIEHPVTRDWLRPRLSPSQHNARLRSAPLHSFRRHTTRANGSALVTDTWVTGPGWSLLDDASPALGCARILESWREWQATDFCDEELPQGFRLPPNLSREVFLRGCGFPREAALAFFMKNAEVVGPLLAAALEGEWRDDSLLREALAAQSPSM